MFGAQDLLQRRAGAWVVADDELVMLDPSSGTYYALDAVGRRVWELLEQPRRFADLLQALRSEYAGDPDRIRAETEHFLEALRDRALLEVSSTRGEPG